MNLEVTRKSTQLRQGGQIIQPDDIDINTATRINLRPFHTELPVHLKQGNSPPWYTIFFTLLSTVIAGQSEQHFTTVSRFCSGPATFILQ